MVLNTKQEYHEERNDNIEPIFPQVQNEKNPFKQLVLSNQFNKFLFMGAIIAVIMQLLFFKYWYPYASFINGDSYSYLASALENSNISTYPIGYPKFLRLFSVFTHSDTALVIFQYLFLQISIISFTLTLFHFYKTSKATRALLLGFMVSNPVLLYLANYIASDALFLSLSLIWLTTLIWIIHKPNLRVILLHVLILFLAFIVRYNALCYPLVSLIAFILYKEKMVIKIIGIFVGIMLIGCFISFNREKYFELTGVKQFSPFSGWQLANNAMYAYKFVPNSELKRVPDKFYYLDKMVRDYFDSTRNNINHPEEKWLAATVYMWTQTAPLRSYMKSSYRKDLIDVDGFKYWAKMAPLYKEYGTYIILNYPYQFIKYYIVPNTIKFYAPPLEFLEYYSTGIDSVKPVAQFWFSYKSNKVQTIFKDFKINVLDFFPAFAGAIYVFFLLNFVSYIMLKGMNKNTKLSKSMIIIGLFWFFNFMFSVFVSPIALRFQLFQIMISYSFALLLLDQLIKDTGLIRKIPKS